MQDLAGKGVLIAGTRRIGGVVARRLGAEGARLAIIYRRSRSAAEALRNELQQHGHDAFLLQADLAVESEVERAVDEAVDHFGRLDFCVNLASDFPRVPFDELSAVDWDNALAAAKGTYLLALHASRAMRQNPGPSRGHLIFCGDWAAGETPYIDFLPYLTGKAAIHFMTRAFALELAPYGILVNAVSPGPTMQANEVSGQEWLAALAETPLHRESSAEDIAEMIATLLKLETITGENIRLDSGRHIAGNEPRQ
jgi:NAD(P)-dependent dehydrogenase (short-subunit alcohol dehydrogenase family)